MSELSVVDRSEINEYDRLANYGTTVNRKIQISTVARSPHYKREAKVRNSPRLSSRISATCYGHSRVPGQVTMLTDDPCLASCTNKSTGGLSAESARSHLPLVNLWVQLLRHSLTYFLNWKQVLSLWGWQKITKNLPRDCHWSRSMIYSALPSRIQRKYNCHRIGWTWA